MVPNREKLIISADDFGISRKANQNILNLIRAGKLNRVSVMSEGVFDRQEIEELKNSGIKLDIHLNLNEKIGSKRKLHKPVWYRGIFFVLKIIFMVNNKAVIRKKWQDEIQKFIEIFNQKPDGINSHEYVHFFPAYFPIALELARKQNIQYVRLGEKDLKEKGIVCRILNYLRKGNLNKFHDSKMETSDYMVSLDWLSETNHFLNNIPEGKTELVLHPERKEEYDLVNNRF
jgi:predicted glycoside hydrolase/deacetylase ChbG (UPF0249 family)